MTEPLILKLREFISTAKYEEALHLCNMELSFLDQDNCDKIWLARIYCFKGIALLSLGNREEALNFFNLAIENNCNYHQAYCNRGYTKDELMKYAEAILDYNRAIELEPNYPLAYNNRCWSKIVIGDCESAIQDFNKAIEQDSFYTMADFIDTINEMLETGKIKEEIYNKLLENSEYQKCKEEYKKTA